MDHTKELIALAHEGNKEARDMLVTHNMGLVYSIAKRFANRGYEMDDIVSIGTIGLIKAIDKFDLNMDVMLSTYAVPMISGEIKRFIRDDGIIKISRSIKENGWKINQAKDYLSQKLKREVTIEEISKETGICTEDIVVAMEASKDVESIYQTIYQSDGNQIYVVDKLAASAKESDHDKIMNHVMLEETMNILEEDEKTIIEMRYFQEKTQSEVAKILGISQVQVSRMEKKILLRMRKNMEV